MSTESLSRRQWITMASAPVVAGALASCATSASRVQAGLTTRSAIAEKIFNVVDFGAVPDGKTLNTKAIQAAIDAATKAKGGMVLIPPGDFLTGTIELKANVTLHLSTGGRILGSTIREDYIKPATLPRGNGNCVLLFATHADNVTIEGSGTIDGQGATFYNGHGDGTGPGSRGSNAATQAAVRNTDRPHLLVFNQCNNLKLKDAFFTASAYHCCRILSCKYVDIDGVRIHNRVNLNNDGYHFNDSQYVNISNTNVACQDDACALFGSCKFITVTNSSFSTRWACFRFGGGQAENITISNCIIYETYGCAIKLSAGGRNSRFENMLFSNLILKDVTGPISINLNSAGRRSTTQPATRPSAFDTAETETQSAASQPATQPGRTIVRNITFSNIRATVVTAPQQQADMPYPPTSRPGETRQCIVINGAHPQDVIENINFTDIHATFAGGGTLEEAHAKVPAIAGEYFEMGTPPAYGIYARNARGLTFSNIRLETTQPDLRPAIVFDHVTDATLTGVNAQGNSQADATVRLIDCADILLTSPRLLSPAAAFLEVEGVESSDIIVEGGSIGKAEKPAIFTNGANESSTKVRS